MNKNTVEHDIWDTIRKGILAAIRAASKEGKATDALERRLEEHCLTKREIEV